MDYSNPTTSLPSSLSLRTASLIKLSLCVCLLVLSGCSRSASDAEATVQSAAQVATGLDVLVEEDFSLLRGKRIGLVINQTSRSGGRHVVPLMVEAGLDVRALFGPEHGIRGQAEAGEKVGNAALDSIPVYSLYGSTRRPPADVLAGLDVLVFDIQDVGARFYTYIATMGESMVAAAEADVPFVVLDRPNPLGGEYVAGWVAEAEHKSLVAPYPIPVAHGLTVGELARMIAGEGFLPGLEELQLNVVEMRGWERDMLWTDLGREWVATSPNIPTFETALMYVGTCFFEGTTFSEGRGTEAPFLTLGAPGVDAARVVADVVTAGLGGIGVRETTFVAVDIPGVATNVKHGEVESAGVRVSVVGARAVAPVEAGVHLLAATLDAAPQLAEGTHLNDRWLTRLAGTGMFAALLHDRATPDQIIASWKADVEAFRRLRAPYLLY